MVYTGGGPVWGVVPCKAQTGGDGALQGPNMPRIASRDGVNGRMLVVVVFVLVILVVTLNTNYIPSYAGSSSHIFILQ